MELFRLTEMEYDISMMSAEVNRSTAAVQVKPGSWVPPVIDNGANSSVI